MKPKSILIKAIIGLVAWIVGMVILFKVDWRVGIAVFLIAASIYADLKTLIKNPDLL